MESYQRITEIVGLGAKTYWNGEEWRWKGFSVPDVDENLAPKGEVVDIPVRFFFDVAKAFGLTIKEIKKELGEKVEMGKISPDKLLEITKKLGKHK